MILIPSVKPFDYMWKDTMQHEYSKSLPSYFLLMYLLFFLTDLLYMLPIEIQQVSTAILVISALIFYPFLMILLPCAIVSGLYLIFKRKSNRTKGWIVWGTAFVLFSCLHLLLLLDTGLFYRYGYHINPHILNIFTTPGGFEGMGMRPNEIALLAAGIAGLFVFHGLLAAGFACKKSLAFAGDWKIRHKKSVYCRYGAVLLIAISSFLTGYIVYTYNHYVMNPEPLLAADAIPIYIKGTSSSLFKSLGIKQPDRDVMRVHIDQQDNLENYPQNPIQRDENAKKRYNVIWMTCESLAARMFTPQIMPNASKFARKAMVFRHHYSGGNVTRQGMFSMFYGLPGNYWHAFLAARRGPLLIDWMLEDGYNFKCITSSKFTYPEFDQTIFFELPSSSLYSDSKGKTFERDQRNIKLFLDTIAKNADSPEPFFAFMFFESPHHPYEFPPEATLFADYINPFNAASVTPEDGPAIIKRAANACYHLDMQLAKVFNLLDEKNLWEDTIVVLVGDHGEEYFEKGYLGHSSKFNEEQTRTPLILYYPGIEAGEYTGMSSHLDIVPMLAPHFGVKNDPSDYSCGFNLLADRNFAREYTLIADWDQVFFTGRKYKSLIPLNPVSLAKQVITDPHDDPLPDVSPFYETYNKELIKVQNDLNRFSARDQEDEDSTHSAFFPAVVAALLAVLLVLILGSRKLGHGTTPEEK